jgi:F420-dependent oxidoreductase-like protein
MKLGLQMGYWGAQPPANALEQVIEAEKLGYDSVWTAESWGSDALTPLAWWGSRTSKIRLGTDLIQLSARQPTATAMAALTMDHLSGGRFVLGLGVSGPQVVEGWYGMPFPKPLARTREYIDIIRKVLAREERVTNDGPHYPLPYPGGLGLGKPLKPITHPMRADTPIILGAEGPKNVALAAEIADGWFPIFYSATHEDMYRDQVEEGWSRRSDARRPKEEFEIMPTVAVVIDDDIDRAADALKPMIALYVGGMGARDMNFHFDVFCRLGYEAEANKIQELYLDGKQADAIAAVPLEMVEEITLVGPKEKIRDELQAWEESLVTTMLIGAGNIDTMRTMAELAL